MEKKSLKNVKAEQLNKKSLNSIKGKGSITRAGFARGGIR